MSNKDSFMELPQSAPSHPAAPREGDSAAAVGAPPAAGPGQHLRNVRVQAPQETAR